MKRKRRNQYRSYTSAPPVDGSSEAEIEDAEITNDEEQPTSGSTPISPATQQIIICRYNDIYKMETLEQGLKRTKSGASAGLDGEVKANYTTKKLQILSEKLKTHQYRPSPTKRV